MNISFTIDCRIAFSKYAEFNIRGLMINFMFEARKHRSKAEISQCLEIKFFQMFDFEPFKLVLKKDVI